MIVDYTKEDSICFIKLIDLEMKRQNRFDGKLKAVKVNLLCDCCNKPFVKWLDDIDLQLSFCCSDKCLKEMERKARYEL